MVSLTIQIGVVGGDEGLGLGWFVGCSFLCHLLENYITMFVMVASISTAESMTQKAKPSSQTLSHLPVPKSHIPLELQFRLSDIQ